MKLPYKWQAGVVSALGLFMVVLDNTIVSVALPRMQEALGTSFQSVTWVATSYFLAQAATIAVSGYLSDRSGTKTMFLAALGLFVLGSALCAAAPTKELLVVSRVVQGVGGGALFPTAFAIVFRAFPPTERAPASAVIGVPVLLAPALGPTIGGYLTTTFDWPAIFLINVPLGVLALVLAATVLPGRAGERAEVGDPPKQGFDAVGLVLAVCGFTALVYGITRAGSHGWGDATVGVFLVVGAVMLAAFVVTELLVSDPVMNVRLFLDRTFLMANLLSWALAAFFFGSLFLLPFFLENVQGKTALAAGGILLSQGLAAAVATVAAGSLYNRVGPRALCVVGFALVAAGTLGLIRLDGTVTGQYLQPWLVARGLGLGLTTIPLQTLALSVISNQAMARASSLVNVTRQVFGAVGVAGMTTYLANRSREHAGALAQAFESGPPTGIAASCLQRSGDAAVALEACARQHAAVAGLNDTFSLIVVGSGACALLAFLIGHDPAVEVARQVRQGSGTTPDAQRPLVGSE